MRLNINLASRRYVNTRGVNAAVGGLSLLLGVWLVYQVQDAAYRQGEIKRLKGATAAAQAKAGQAKQVSEPQYRDALGQIRTANQMLAKKSLDWLPLLDNLEGAVPDGMALTAIEPDRKGSSVRIAGITRSFGAVRVFLENLEQSRYFSEVYLLTQQQTKVGLTQHGVAFSVSCKVGGL